MRRVRGRKGMCFSLLVTYKFKSKNGMGFGRTTKFKTNRKVISESDLSEMELDLIKENGFENVVITGYQFMSR